MAFESYLSRMLPTEASKKSLQQNEEFQKEVSEVLSRIKELLESDLRNNREYVEEVTSRLTKLLEESKIDEYNEAVTSANEEFDSLLSTRTEQYQRIPLISPFDIKPTNYESIRYIVRLFHRAMLTEATHETAAAVNKALDPVAELVGDDEKVVGTVTGQGSVGDAANLEFSEEDKELAEQATAPAADYVQMGKAVWDLIPFKGLFGKLFSPSDKEETSTVSSDEEAEVTMGPQADSQPALDEDEKNEVQDVKEQLKGISVHNYEDVLSRIESLLAENKQEEILEALREVVGELTFIKKTLVIDVLAKIPQFQDFINQTGGLQTEETKQVTTRLLEFNEQSSKNTEGEEEDKKQVNGSVDADSNVEHPEVIEGVNNQDAIAKESTIVEITTNEQAVNEGIFEEKQLESVSSAETAVVSEVGESSEHVITTDVVPTDEYVDYEEVTDSQSDDSSDESSAESSDENEAVEAEGSIESAETPAVEEQETAGETETEEGGNPDLPQSGSWFDKLKDWVSGIRKPELNETTKSAWEAMSAPFADYIEMGKSAWELAKPVANSLKWVGGKAWDATKWTGNKLAEGYNWVKSKVSSPTQEGELEEPRTSEGEATTSEETVELTQETAEPIEEGIIDAEVEEVEQEGNEESQSEAEIVSEALPAPDATVAEASSLWFNVTRRNDINRERNKDKRVRDLYGSLFGAPEKSQDSSVSQTLTPADSEDISDNVGVLEPSDYEEVSDTEALLDKDDGEEVANAIAGLQEQAAQEDVEDDEEEEERHKEVLSEMKRSSDSSGGIMSLLSNPTILLAGLGGIIAASLFSEKGREFWSSVLSWFWNDLLSPAFDGLNNLIKDWLGIAYGDRSDESDADYQLDQAKADATQGKKVKKQSVYHVDAKGNVVEGAPSTELGKALTYWDKLDVIDAAVGAGTGAAVGAGTGAALGSFIPGLGTAVGAGIGAGVGALIGWISQDTKAADKIIDNLVAQGMSKEQAKGQVKLLTSVAEEQKDLFKRAASDFKRGKIGQYTSEHVDLSTVLLKNIASAQGWLDSKGNLNKKVIDDLSANDIADILQFSANANSRNTRYVEQSNGKLKLVGVKAFNKVNFGVAKKAHDASSWVQTSQFGTGYYQTYRAPAELTDTDTWTVNERVKGSFFKNGGRSAQAQAERKVIQLANQGDAQAQANTEYGDVDAPDFSKAKNRTLAIEAWEVAKKASKALGADPRFMYAKFAQETGHFKPSAVQGKHNFGNALWPRRAEKASSKGITFSATRENPKQRGWYFIDFKSKDDAAAYIVRMFKDNKWDVSNAKNGIDFNRAIQRKEFTGKGVNYHEAKGDRMGRDYQAIASLYFKGVPATAAPSKKYYQRPKQTSTSRASSSSTRSHTASLDASSLDSDPNEMSFAFAEPHNDIEVTDFGEQSPVYKWQQATAEATNNSMLAMAEPPQDVLYKEPQSTGETHNDNSQVNNNSSVVSSSQRVINYNSKGLGISTDNLYGA